ncbi:MAG: DUF1822 family protein [Cyanobacteriota bacterium]|nr:DUF1822 family protein [Cyanobacteriota bacterium]
MTNFEQINRLYYRQLHLQTIDLEPEDFQQATLLSDRFNNEAQQWQAYVKILGLLALKKWLSDRHLTLDNPIESLPPHQIISSEPICPLQVAGFKVCLLTDENIVNEGIEIPEKMIDYPGFAAHFYILIQVSVEEEEAILIGFIRHDQFKNRSLQKNEIGNYQLSLTQLNYDSSHLILNLKYLSPAAIQLPENTLVESKTWEKLTSWLERIFTEGWQPVEELLGNREPMMQKAFRFRGSGAGVRRAIDLGNQLGGIPLALMIEILPEPNQRFTVSSRVYPLQEQHFLPANLKLIVLDEMGKPLSESRRQRDDYIQLPPFTAEPGDRFSLQIVLNSATVTKHFII